VTGLAEAGCSVALTYTTSKAAPSIASEIATATGSRVSAYQCEVQDSAAIGATVDSVLAEFGRLDIVVANAGVTLEKDALEYTPDEFRRVMSVNLDGAFYTAQAAGRAFRGQKEGVNAKAFDGGSLIVTSSVSSHLVNLPQKQAAYNASKAGIEQLAKCLAVEWVRFARVNCVCPGFIATDSELREMGESSSFALAPTLPIRG
jgi:sorbose reductase